MKAGWFFLLVLVFVLSCSNKKRTSLTDDDTVEVNDFIDFFPPIKLPVTIADTSLQKKIVDSSSLIGNKIFASFVPDTVLLKVFGKGSNPKLYPIGQVTMKKAETYLLIKGITSTKKAAYVLVFDEEKNFKAALPLVTLPATAFTSQTATMDTKYTFVKVSQRKKTNGEIAYHRDAYVYNNAGIFTLILTESNDDVSTTGELLNPLDTFPRKNKYSGDYVKDKRNIISIRDGRKPSQLRFFIHFEKDKGTCNGELRGELNIVKPNVALYQEVADPCILEFNFATNSVNVKETQGCGNYRDIKCFFEGNFPRKKEPKPKATKKK